jgi:hypothetical protein
MAKRKRTNNDLQNTTQKTKDRVTIMSQLIRYSNACGSYQDFFDIWLLLRRKPLNHGSYWLSLSHHLESAMVATMTWLTAIEYLFHK